MGGTHTSFKRLNPAAERSFDLTEIEEMDWNIVLLIAVVVLMLICCGGMMQMSSRRRRD